MQIKDSRLRFRYNLNSLRTEERDIWLSAIAVDDGQWHTVRVSRYGSAATLELDGGEGRRFNETFSFEGHQWLLVDKQEGVYAGGKAEYTGVRTFEVYQDYQKGEAHRFAESLTFLFIRKPYFIKRIDKCNYICNI